MFWLLPGFFCCWLIYREFRSTVAAPVDLPLAGSVSVPYVATLALLALAAFWQPLDTRLTERRWSAVATTLADDRVAHLHCNSVLDTMFDPNSTNIGHARPDTGEIAFQYPWCGTLKAYLRHPERADRDELTSLGMLTHESMHVRGELREAIAECQAVQRNYRTARLLGVPERTARRNALEYYYTVYRMRALKEGDPDRYFTEDCAPGRALDEDLPDSTWKVR